MKKEGGACIKQEKDPFATGSGDKKDGQNNAVKVEKDLKDAQRAKELKLNESEMVRDLKTQLKYVIIFFMIVVLCMFNQLFIVSK